MNKELALEEFNRNQHYIETLTKKYITYNNYEDILQQAYLISWKALLKYDGNWCYKDSSSSESESSSRHLPASQPEVKVTTWIYSNVAPALNKYIAKEIYHIKNNVNWMKNIEIDEVNIDDVDVGDRVNVEEGVESRDSVDRIYAYVDNINRATNKTKSIYKEWLKSKEEDKAVSLDCIGKKYGVTKQRVNNIVKKYNGVMRKYLAENT